jgi:hypothetical protein
VGQVLGVLLCALSFHRRRDVPEVPAASAAKPSETAFRCDCEDALCIGRSRNSTGRAIRVRRSASRQHRARSRDFDRSTARMRAERCRSLFTPGAIAAAPGKSTDGIVSTLSVLRLADFAIMHLRSCRSRLAVRANWSCLYEHGPTQYVPDFGRKFIR